MLQCVVNCGQSCFDALSIGYLAILKRHVEIDPREVKKKTKSIFCKNNENLPAILDKDQQNLINALFPLRSSCSMLSLPAMSE